MRQVLLIVASLAVALLAASTGLRAEDCHRSAGKHDHVANAPLSERDTDAAKPEADHSHASHREASLVPAGHGPHGCPMNPNADMCRCGPACTIAGLELLAPDLGAPEMAPAEAAVPRAWASLNHRPPLPPPR